MRSHGYSKSNDAKSLIKNMTGLDKFEAYLSKKQDLDDADQHTKTKVSNVLVDNLSAPDFHLWEMLDQLESLCKFYNLPCVLDSTYPLLASFKTSLESLPEVAPYLKSDYIHIPYNNPYARFGANPSTLGKYERGMETPWKGKGIVLDIREPCQIIGQKRKLTAPSNESDS
jgi:hypothetical protein